VIRGAERKDSELAHFGTKIRTIPAGTFLEEYNRTPASDEVQAIADDYMGRAQRLVMTTRQDVLNGVKSYVVARTLLEREEGDGITMDCLGALGKSQVSLPCIAWSRMLDHNIPAACEADLGPAVTHAIVQTLFDRPGFQQDPVPDTGDGTLIGAHCSCPTRLNGFSEAPEAFYLSCHHGKRDAVPRTVWKEGRRMTSVVVGLGSDKKPPHMVISSGTVVGNISVPPAGGCVVSVKVKLDGVDDLLAYPGFHQLFVYGDFKRDLAAYCRLFGIEAKVV
jgi:L-fucose isomerase-like protein